MNYAKMTDPALVIEAQNANQAVVDALAWQKDVQHEINRRCVDQECSHLVGPSLNEEYESCQIHYRPTSYGPVYERGR